MCGTDIIALATCHVANSHKRASHTRILTCLIPVKLPWIFPGAPLNFNWAPRNIQGNLDGYDVCIHQTEKGMAWSGHWEVGVSGMSAQVGTHPVGTGQQHTRYIPRNSIMDYIRLNVKHVHFYGNTSVWVSSNFKHHCELLYNQHFTNNMD